MVEGNEVQQAVDRIAEAKLAADRLEAANAKSEALANRLEAIEARSILGGKSAVSAPEVEKKVETPEEYAKRIMQGKK